jgi:hypothetical protein
MSFSIIIARDEIGPAARRLQIGLQPDRLFPIVGRSGVNTIREHLFGLNQTRPNAMGGARTNFYASAARGTHFDAVADGVKISINQVGMAQRYFGGVITAKKVKLLTIPACPEAYGHRASEFPGLTFVVLGGKPALVRYAQTILGSRTVKGQKRFYGKRKVEFQVMFWLKHSVDQAPDETVLPYTELIGTRIERDVGSYVERLYARAGDATGGQS